MSLFLTGVSHKTAPVEVRERLACGREALGGGLRSLVDGEVVREGMILSTCNRVEVLADVDPSRFEEGKRRVRDFLASRGEGSGRDAGAHLYEHAEGEAVRH